MKALAQAEMKLSGTGLMPLVVSWVWNWEESGKRREGRAEAERQTDRRAGGEGDAGRC